VAGPTALVGRRRRGVPLPRAGQHVLPGVPGVTQEHRHRHGRHDRRARVLPQHCAHRRRAAHHGVAAGQHERLQAGEPLLVAHCTGSCQFRVLPGMCNIVQVPKRGKVARKATAFLDECSR
jgi:hypothetical protein